MANEEEIGPKALMLRDRKQRGFDNLTATPHFIFDRKLGLHVRDVEFYGAVLLVSGRAKTWFEELDEEAFAFCACDFENRYDTEDSDYWLCDVVRIVDAIDASGPNIKRDLDILGRLYYPLAFSHRIAIKADVEPNHHVFRPMHMESSIFADNEAYQKWRKDKLSGLKFYDLLRL